MHELGIANSVLEAVRTEARHRPGARFTKVVLRVGELAGVDRDSLTFCFGAIVKGTELEPLELAIEACPRRHRCSACGHEFAVVDYEVACPKCGNERTVCIGGDELEMAYLEMEEP